MLYDMKEKYKKIYGMQAAVVLNLLHQGKDLLAFMKQGMEKGMKEGMEKGMSQRSLEIAKKMLAKGMYEASIMDMTGLTSEEIKLLKAEM